MPRWGMVIDLDKCTGCQACVVACKVENNVSVVDADQAAMGREMLWIRIMPFVEGEYPRIKRRFLPILCQHCDHPPCTQVCPVGATYESPQGIVGQIYPRCIGCRYCMNACPYTIKYFNWYAPKWAEIEKNYLNPMVSLRPRGVVEKCTFCSHRLILAREQAAAEKRPLREGDFTPACVESCPARAMYFGDLEDSTSAVSRLSQSARSFRLLEDLGTEPKVIYLAEGEWRGALAG